MEHKLPYYLTYPISELWDEEKMSKRDREYVQSIYPEMAKMLLPYIEKECDRLEYDGSLIYDEYPDKLLLRLMCSRVYKIAEREFEKMQMRFEEIEKQWVKEMTEVLAYHELCKRREEWRNTRRKWY